MAPFLARVCSLTRRYTPPGHHRTAAAFREHLRSLDPAFDCEEELLGPEGPLGRPLTVFGREAGNRFAVHPMEGWDGNRDGSPSELTRRRWRRFGLSGAKLVWGGEAVAVVPEGRANPNQLFIDGSDRTTASSGSKRYAARFWRAMRRAGSGASARSSACS